MDDRAADGTDSADTGLAASPAAAGGLSARAAAGVLGINERTVRRAIERGELPAARYAGSFRIARTDLAAFHERLVAGRPRPRPPFGRRNGSTAAATSSVRLVVPPPLRRSPLPVALTSLVGRRPDIDAVSALFRADEARLVTLTGPGGVGKTRLALATAGDVGAEFADGVAFVPLAAISSPALVAPAIARALDLPEVRDRTPEQQLRAVLHERRLLLVLDNFEQIVAAAPLVTDLLSSCPRLAVLVTSREVLRLSGENVYAVPPLDPGQAARLFAERAQAARLDRDLAATDPSAVAEICRRLDHLPLAIELAAARTPLLSPGELLTRLQPRLPLLTGGARDQPDRLRTMRDAIAWSYDLLPAHEQRLFRVLGIFTGGFTLEAAETIAGADGPEQGVLDDVSSLVSKSLVRQQDAPGNPPRLEMLETVREFALERLEASGAAETVRKRHTEWCLDLVERAEASLLGEWDGRWPDRLDAELDNLRSALAWTCDRGHALSAVRLAAGLFPYWFYRARFIEGRSWFERVLALSGDVPPSLRAKLLHAAGGFDRIAGDLDRAEARAKEGQALARASGDAAGLALSLKLLAEIAEDREDYAAVASPLETAHVLFQRVGDRFWTAITAGCLGDLARIRRDLDEAERHYRESLAIYEELGHAWGQAYVLKDLAFVDYVLGHYAQAASSWRESLGLFWQQRLPWHVEGRLQSLALVAAATGDHARAARLFGAAEALSEVLGTPLPPRRRTAMEPSIATIRTGLGDDEFAVEWAAGRAMTIEEAVAEAMAAPPIEDAAGSEHTPTPGVGLTRRELEVLRLLADGLSYREIADALFISHRTVSTHVTGIVGKLGVGSSRAAIAAARRHGLL